VPDLLYRIRLKPGSEPAVRELLAELTERRAEAEETLRGEGAEIESFFLSADELWIFKRVEDPARMKAFQDSSSLPLYDRVRAVARESFLSMERLESQARFEAR
jgi:hypothetical protein